MRLTYREARTVSLARLSGSIPRVDFTSFTSRTNDFPPTSHSTTLATNTTPLHTSRACKTDWLTASLIYCYAISSFSLNSRCDLESVCIFMWRSKPMGPLWFQV